MDSLPDDVIRIINSWILDPIDSVRFASCNHRVRAILPPPPLRIRIIGCSNNALAETFYVSRCRDDEDDPATTARSVYWLPPPLTVNDRVLFGPHYILWLVREREGWVFLGRGRRIGAETPADAPHHACRFGLNLLQQQERRGMKKSAADDIQTWTVSHGQQRAAGEDVVVPWNTPIGLSVGGTSTDLFLPNNHDRRILTSRIWDWNVVVNLFNCDERIRLVPESDNATLDKVWEEPRLDVLVAPKGEEADQPSPPEIN